MRLILGNALEKLAKLPSESVQCVVTSPPYFGLRDYGTDGLLWPDGWRGSLGHEPTPQMYVGHLVAIFREVRGVLRKDGVCWIVIGDSYNAAGRKGHGTRLGYKQGTNRASMAGSDKSRPNCSELKPKDLIGIPWLLAFALRDDGWYLRGDVIWCLSGGTWVYARTHKGDMPITIKDLHRLKPKTVRLWNGRRWTQLLGMSKRKRCGTELEIVLRSGERISCTPSHKFPTNRGLIEAGQLHVGDVIETVTLPEPEPCRQPSHIGLDAAWLAGLYIAEGSMSGDTIQFTGHARETSRLERIQRIAEGYGCSTTCTVKGNCQNIRVYGKVLNAILAELVAGRTAKDKGFAPVVWRYGNDFLAAMICGYLEGDGHHDSKNHRWSLGFTRNYNLERDLRTACARLGYALVLRLSHTSYNGSMYPTFRGELRKARSGHHNERPLSSVVEVRKARCREVYDLGIEDEPHLFALASGILSHNSKRNPMPESVRDRCTRSHEYIFMLTKSAKYYWDADAIAEDSVSPGCSRHLYTDNLNDNRTSRKKTGTPTKSTRNKRDVWFLSSEPTAEAHFATFPTALVDPCVLSSTSERGACASCGTPWKRLTKRTPMRIDRSHNHPAELRTRTSGAMLEMPVVETIGWAPQCKCEGGVRPCVVLDPFMGSGTVGLVCQQHSRDFIGIELNEDYIDIALRRLWKRWPELEVNLT